MLIQIDSTAEKNEQRKKLIWRDEVLFFIWLSTNAENAQKKYACFCDL